MAESSHPELRMPVRGDAPPVPGMALVPPVPGAPPRPVAPPDGKVVMAPPEAVVPPLLPPEAAPPEPASVVPPEPTPSPLELLQPQAANSMIAQSRIFLHVPTVFIDESLQVDRDVPSISGMEPIRMGHKTSRHTRPLPPSPQAHSNRVAPAGACRPCCAGT